MSVFCRSTERAALWIVGALLAPIGLNGCASAGRIEGVSAQDRRVHEQAIVLDTHLDTPRHFGRPGWRFADRHTADADFSYVDYPRMVEGGLDGGFWSIFTVQRALTPEGYAAASEHALGRAAQIRSTIESHPRLLDLVTTAEQAERSVRHGRRAVFMSIENAYPLGMDVSQLRKYYEIGVRMVGLVHGANNQFADSATDDRPQWQGLSALGIELVREANRLGMVVDASHASDAAFDQMLALSRAPIILSHSGCSAVYRHPRNIDDARLRALAAAGGVIQINSVGSFLTSLPRTPERDEAMRPLRAKYGWVDGLNAQQVAEYAAARSAIDSRYPPAQATLDDFMRHLLHALAVVGVEHVGIGMDWDGGGGVKGLEDVSKLPVITAGLRRAGYSASDIEKIMGGNTLRVVRAVAAAASQQDHR